MAERLSTLVTGHQERKAAESFSFRLEMFFYAIVKLYCFII